MRHRRNPRIALAVLAATSIVAGACGSDDNGSSDGPAQEGPALDPVRGGSLRVALEAEIDSFAPGSARWSSSALFIAKSVYDPLAAFDENGVAKPYLAESITPSEDFMTWEVTVRPDVTFHDGSPLDAEALRANLDQVMIQSALTKSAFRPVASVEISGPLSVTVTMSTPWAHLDTVLANQTGFIVAPSMYAENAPIDPIGTGPFRYVSWEPDVEYKGERFEDYWQDAPDGEPLPYLDEVSFTPIVDPDTRYSAVQTGDVQLIQTQAASQIEQFTNGDADGLNVLIDVSEGTESNIMFNSETGPFADVDLRLAATQAINRDAMLSDLFAGTYDVANGPFAEASGWGTIENFPEFDPEAAAALVEAWSERNGGATPSVTLTTLPTNENKLIGNYVAEQWESVGIETSVATIEEAAGSAAIVAGTLDAILWSFWDRPDPDALYHYWYSDSTLNFPKYRSEVVDAGLDAGRPIIDKDARAEAYQGIWDDFGANVPIIWLYHSKWALVYRPEIGGVGDVVLPDGEKGQPMTYGNTFLTRVFDTSVN